MKSLLFLGLVALAVASNHIRIPSRQWLDEVVPERRLKDINDKSFRSGREYKFVYDGQLASGIPGSSQQHSMIRVQSVCVLQFRSSDDVQMKLTHVRIGKLNTQIPRPDKMVPFTACEEVHVDQDLLQQLTTPVDFHYKDGMISQVRFDESEVSWSANIKRGVLNMLQVNLQKKNKIDNVETSGLGLDSNDNDYDQLRNLKSGKTDSYGVSEKTLEGECDTYYTVTSQPCYRCDGSRSVLNVTKSIDFEKCKQRPQIKYNYRFQELCPTCDNKYNDKEKVVKSSTLMRYDISGDLDNFLIEYCKVDSRYTVVPFDESSDVISTYVKQRLTLVKTCDIQTRIESLRNPIDSDSDMIYTQDWDIMKEKFFMDGDNQFGRKSPYSDISNKVQFFKSILSKLCQYIQKDIDQEAPRQYARMVKFMRMLKRDELEQIHDNFYKQTPSDFTPEDRKKIKDMLIDSIAQCGTVECVGHLVDKIKNRDVHPIKGALAIKKLIDVRTVSKKMIDQLMDLGDHEVCNRNPFLKQSVWLTCGSLINGMCSPNKDRLAREQKHTSGDFFCSRDLKEKYVQTLFRKFRDSDSTNNKVLYLKTISNCGLDVSIGRLERIIRNTDSSSGSSSTHSTLIRMQAVQALRKLVSQMPRKIQRLCLPIVLNDRENSDLRIMCFYVLMQTQPSRPILNQISMKMVNEGSRQMKSFVYTHMMTLANSTNPCEKRIAQDLKLSLRLGERIPYSKLWSMSRYIQQRWYSYKNNLGLGLDYSVLMSKSTYLPKHVSNSFHLNYYGQWSKYLFTLGLEQIGSEKWLNSYLRDSGLYDLDDSLGTGRNPKDIYSGSSGRELKSLFKKLSMTDRQSDNDNDNSRVDPFVMAYMKYKNLEYGYVPLSPDLLTKFFGDFDWDKVRDYLRTGYNMQYYTAGFNHEMSRKIPTSIGIPIRYSFKIPTVVKLTGQVKTVDNRFTLNVRPSIATTLVHEVECWSPIVNSGVKVLVEGKVYTPINCDLDLGKTSTYSSSSSNDDSNDYDSSKPQLKLTCKTNGDTYDLFRIGSRPVTYTRQWPKTLQQWEEPKEKTIVREEWNRVHTIDRDFGEKSLGVKFHLKGYWHKTPTRSVPGTPGFPMSGPNKLRLTVSPGMDMPEKVTVYVSGDFWRVVREEDSMRPSFSRFYKSKVEREYFTNDEEDSLSYYNRMSGRLPEPFRSQGLNQDRMSQFFKTYTPKDLRKTTLKMRIESSGSSTDRKCLIDQVIKCDRNSRYCHMSTDVERTPIPGVESEPWKYRGELEILYPTTPYTITQVLGKKMICNIHSHWGPKSNPENSYCTLRIQGEHSKRQVDLILNNKKFRICNEPGMEDSCKRMFSPVSQYDDVLKASDLTKYKIDVDYNLPTWMKKQCNHMYRSLKAMYFKQTDVDQITVRNPQDKVRCQLSFCPKSFQYLNVSCQTPTEDCKISDIGLPVPMRPVNVRRSSNRITYGRNVFSSLNTDNYDRPICKINSERVRTFDGVRYRAPLTTCYSVLAKDCRERDSKFAVLIKKKSRDSDQKKLKILTDLHKILISKYDSGSSVGSFKVIVNGEDCSNQCDTDGKTITENGRVVFKCYKYGPYVKISLPTTGIKVYFDGYACNVKMSRSYYGLQCGLCGHYNGEPSDDFRGPDNTQYDYHSLNRFFKSYLHTDDSQESCTVDDSDRDYLDNLDNYRYRHSDLERKHRHTFSDSGRDWDQDRSSSSSSSSGSFDSTDFSSSRRQDRDYSYGSGSYQDSDDDYRMTGGYKRQPVDRTKVIEHGHELCFSKESVPRCPRHSYPLTYDEPKKVVYCCLSRDDPQADVYHRRSRQLQVIPEVRDLPSSFTETEVVPRTCTTY